MRQHLIEAARSKKLDRIALGYAVGAWAVVQAISIAAPTFYWPQWVLQAAIIVALLGLPIALIAGWVLGVRDNVSGVLRPSRADYQVLLALGLFLAVAAPIFAWTFWPRSPPSAIRDSSVLPPANSLAVLPFANLSGDPGKRYLSEGVSDELINRLAQIPSLRVAARTSSFAFEDKHVDAKSIARVLNVHALLEGSVREAGNRVRIAAQLVNGADGFQIWSQSYDRELTDVLALQDDIARSVTGALTVKLLPASRAAQSVDFEAYRLYLQGKFYVTQGNKDDLRKAITLLNRATQRAPNFADGLAMLGNAEVLLDYNYSDASLIGSAEQSLKRALFLDPRNMTALKAMTDLNTVTWRWRDVLKYARAIFAINPSSYEALIVRSGVADAFGFIEESSRADLAASKLDPLSLVSKFNVAAGYRWQHKYDEAARYVRDALILNPSDPDARNLQCLIEVDRGNLAKATQLSALLPKAGGDQNMLGCSFDLAIAEGNVAAGRAMVSRAAADVEKNGGSNTDIGDSYLKVGDFTNAMKWYERAYVARERALLGVPRLAPPDRRAFFERPQWKALWNRPPIKEWRAVLPEAARVLGIRT
jgi:adenylate cyclase